MKASLSLEYIGEAQEAPFREFGGLVDAVAPGMGGYFSLGPASRKPWVAEITTRQKTRVFVRGKWQRKRSNSNASRGVEIWFLLESGKLYEAKHHVSWTRAERFFCTVDDDGDVVRLTNAEVDQWLKDRLAWTF